MSRTHTTATAPPVPLTEVDVELITGYARGRTAASIAGDLGLSLGGVRSRTHTLAKRLGITGARQPALVNYAYQHGYVRALTDLPHAMPLTPRLTQVLVCLARGMNHRATAAELGIAVTTVVSHREELLKRLRARSGAHAVALAWSTGLLHADRPAPPHRGALHPMSRVYFHSPTRDAELRGSERAWLRGLVEDLAVGMLDLHRPDRLKQLVSLAAPEHYVTSHARQYPNGMPLPTAYRLAFLNDDPLSPPVMQYRGHRIDTFCLMLNTALQLGNEQVQLAARLHGQCELHAWVDGPNRAWLADIMQAGLDSGLYRRRIPYRETPGSEPTWSDQGWDDVIALLRERDDEPVVTSFSVTDQFPNPGEQWAKYGEEWFDLDSADQWRIGMHWLRQDGRNLELKPGLGDRWFDHGLSIVDLIAPDWEDRLSAALTTPVTEERPS